jgi:hypothetical protein
VRKWFAAAGTVWIAALVLLSGAAGAKQFAVQTCTTEDRHAPLAPAIAGPNLPSGWEVGWSGQAWPETDDRCVAGDRFTFRIYPGRPMASGDSVWVRWTAAPGTVLVRLSATWQAASDLHPDRGQGTAQLTAGTDQQVRLTQAVPFAVWFGVSGAPPFTAQVLPARWFELRFTCLDQCATDGVEALYAYVLSARFYVDDSSAPVGGLTGAATDAQTWSRSTHFLLNSADVGGGLARAVVEVDGADALGVPLSDPQGTCRDIGPAPGVAQYAAVQPCPLRIDNGSLDIDASKLPQGQHVVRVLLEDAAGNRTPIFGPVTRTITSSEAIGPGSDPALRGAANGDGASDLARLTAHWGQRGSRTLLVSRFGRRHIVRGRLRTTEGAPIANAAIDMVSKTTAVNARELAKRAGPKTGADGGWRVALPKGVSSRDVTFRYRSHVNDTIAAATASVRLRVRAGLHLTIHPRRAKQGQAIHFDGRLLGGPLPRGGKQVVLLARASRGGWVRFNVVRTDRGGRFRTIYRFRQAGATVYRFRALSLSEAAYPYLAGGSNVVKVRKR